MNRGSVGIVMMGLVVGCLSSSPVGAEQPLATPELEGWWILEATTASILSSRAVGEIPSQSTVLSVVKIKQRGRALKLHSRTCDVRLEADTPMVTTRVPRRFVEAIDDRRRRGQLKRQHGAWYVHLERDWELLGLQMEDPARESLPTDKEDPRIIDQDDSGHPGMTIELEGRMGGEVHIIRRSWDQMMGRLQGDERIAGPIRWDFEQHTVDASRRWLRSDLSGTPDMESSRFRMQRHHGQERPRCRALRGHPPER